MTVTPDMLRTATMRQDAHLNGGSVFFGYTYRCIQYPRLEKIVKYYKRDRSMKVTWRVDGADPEYASAEEALPALNTPPVLTEAEQHVLGFVTKEWRYLDRKDMPEELKSLKTGMFEPGSLSYSLYMLRAKGLIEAQQAMYRLRQEEP